MVVYVDILFFLNLFVNTFLLRAAGQFCGVKGRLWREFFGAALGAAFSLMIFLPNIPFFFNILIKLALSAILILTAYGFKNKKRFLRLWGSFFTATFLFAGFMMALWFCLRPPGMAVNNGVVYFSISPLILIISTLLCYLLITLVRRIFRVGAVKNDTYTLEITLGGCSVVMTALLDTGHSLVDILSGAPVIIADYNAVEPLLPALSRPAFTNVAYEPPEDLKDRYRLIPYSVIGGAGLLPAFRPDFVRIVKKDGTQTFRNVCVAVHKQPLSGRFSALFGSELLNSGEMEYELAGVQK